MMPYFVSSPDHRYVMLPLVVHFRMTLCRLVRKFRLRAVCAVSRMTGIRSHCSLPEVISVFSSMRTTRIRITLALLIYSLNNGLPDCSKVSTISVKGDVVSLWLSSFDISSKLCVRRCWRLRETMLSTNKCKISVDGARVLTEEEKSVT